MTVKELREILDGCNDDAIVVIKDLYQASSFPENRQVFHINNYHENSVVFDLGYHPRIPRRDVE